MTYRDPVRLYRKIEVHLCSITSITPPRAMKKADHALPVKGAPAIEPGLDRL